MNGSGCKTCPVNPCHTLYYRGSYCAEQRAKHGLGDPLTNADRIRAMTDEELAVYLCRKFVDCEANICPGTELCVAGGGKANGLKKWIQQPAEDNNG